MKPRAIRILLLCLGLVLAGYAVFSLSPWPAALLIRFAFGYDAARTTAALAAHVPAGIREQRDIAYGSAPEERLDVYQPQGGAQPRKPTIVWIHGGGFVAGDRQDVAPYLKVLAGRGYATVAIGYTRAPAAHYPGPVLQANAALGFLQREGARLGIDPQHIVLAGDSSGAHIAAQLASALTGPDYAALIGLTPAVEPTALKGTVLFCGLFDPTALDLTGPVGTFIRAALFGYFGTANPLDSERITQAAIPRYVTEAFPPSFISVGNGDLLAPQSVTMAQALRDRGVRVDTLFFPPEHEPQLEHGYQFNLDSSPGREALERLTTFLNRLGP